MHYQRLATVKLKITAVTVFGTFSQKYRDNGTVNGTVLFLKIKISL